MKKHQKVSAFHTHFLCTRNTLPASGIVSIALVLCIGAVALPCVVYVCTEHIKKVHTQEQEELRSVVDAVVKPVPLETSRLVSPEEAKMTEGKERDKAQCVNIADNTPCPDKLGGTCQTIQLRQMSIF